MSADVRPESSARRGYVGDLLFGASLLWFVVEFWRPRPHLDDAYISYRYARNLAEGHGLVYNLGEYVEGFTNLLWTLLVAGGARAGLEPPLTGHILGLASGAALLSATYFYARAAPSGRGSWLAGLAPWLVLATPGFAFWSTSGMETPLFAAATTAALAAAAHRRMDLATLMLCVATLTRPDGAMAAVVVYSFELRRIWQGGWRARRGPLVYFGLICALTGFRWIYYGSLVPNTFHAKVGGMAIAHGAEYASSFLADGSLLLLLPAVLAVVNDRRFRAGGAFVVVTFAYVISLGGDAFPFYRFLLPVLPCLVVLSVQGIARALDRNPNVGAALLLTLPAALSLYLFGRIEARLLVAAGAPIFAWVIAPRLQWLVGRSSAIKGIALLVSALALGTSDTDRLIEAPKRRTVLNSVDENMRQDEVLARTRSQRILSRRRPAGLVATGAIGSFGYYSRLPIVDIYGLVDAHIASRSNPSPAGFGQIAGHLRSDADYVFSREPDYILIPNREGRPFLTTPAQVALWAHPDLEKHYVWVQKIRGYRRKTGK